MADESVFEGLNGTQKSAILMMLLGEDEASEILKNLSPKEVQHLGTAMYSVPVSYTHLTLPTIYSV